MAQFDFTGVIEKVNLSNGPDEYPYRYWSVAADNHKKLRYFLDYFTYKLGWELDLQTEILAIRVLTVDSTQNNSHKRHPVEDSGNYYTRENLSFDIHEKYITKSNGPFYVIHSFAIPEYPFRDLEETERWVLDCILMAETHEALEFFKFKGRPNYFPDHEHPYRIQRVESPTS